MISEMGPSLENYKIIEQSTRCEGLKVQAPMNIYVITSFCTLKMLPRILGQPVVKRMN